MRGSKSLVIHSAKAATGFGTSVYVGDCTDVILAISTASSANMTILIAGSYGKTLVDDGAPAFTSSASKTNQWAYLNTVRLDTNAVIAGATGYAYSGTDAVIYVEVNTNGLLWLNVNVSAYAAGNIDVKLIGFVEAVS